MKTIIHLTTVHNVFDNRIFYKECAGLADKGYRVYLVAPHDKNEIIEKVEIIPLPRTRLRLVRLICLSFLAFCEAIKVKDADIIHFHDPELIPVGLILKYLKGKKIIYDVHEDYSTAIRQKKYLPYWLRDKVAKIYCWVEKKITNQFTIVLAERYYSNRFAEGIEVLNYPKINQFAGIEISGAYPSYPNLIYTGNVTEDRGALIHASILKVYSDARITYIGYCSKIIADKVLAESNNSERIKLVGINSYIPFTEIMEYYRKERWTAGLAIFPPSPHYINKELTKLYEYMGAGIPIICSDFPAWRDLVESNGAGICVAPLDLNAIFKALKYLMENPDKAKQMGDRGREAVLKKFNWERELDKLTALYENMAKH